MKYCVVRACNSKWKQGALNKRYHGFPKDQHIRNEWAMAVGITREISEHHYVCSEHFRASDYTVTNYGYFPGQLKKSAIPSRNLTNSKNSSSKTNDDGEISVTTARSRVTNFTLPCSAFVFIKAEAVDDDEMETQPQEFNDPLHPIKILSEIKKEPTEPAIKPEPPTPDPDPDRPAVITRTVGTQASYINLRISYDTMSDTEVDYGTGFDRRQFNYIYGVMERNLQIPDSLICLKRDAVLVTLFMLRHNMNLKMTEFIFGLSRRSLAAITLDLVDRLELLLSKEEVWASEFRRSRRVLRLLENIKTYREQKELLASRRNANA